MERTKKGFTVVELVIVIAVIAILVSVLIPTFSTLINKANVSKDTQLCRVLNEELKVQEAETDYVKPETYSDLLAKISNKYTIQNITPTSKGDIVWDQNTNTFALIENNKMVYKYNDKVKFDESKANLNLWKIVSEVPANLADQKYSMYLKDNANVTSATVAVGFDAGNNTNITSLTYDRSTATEGQDVIIRTNGGTLTIDAPKDTVNHYNTVDKVWVKHINNASYHENGTVAVSMEVNDGHVVVEKTGHINKLAVPEVTTGDTVSVNIQNGGVVLTAIVDDNEATVEVENGATIEQFIGETTNVSGAGASAVAENVVSKVSVATAQELQTALNNGEKYIVLADDITTSAFKLDGETDNRNFFTIMQDVTIDGNGKTITGNFGSAGRGIVVDNDNVKVNILNLTLNGTTARALQVHSNHSNVEFKLDRVNLSSTMYGINICGGTLNVKITALDCNVSSWGALNVWGNSHTLKFYNCELTGTNDKSVSSSNTFSTICLEADTTEVTTEYSAFNYVLVAGGKINAIETNANKQFAVTFNNGVVGASGSTIELANVEIETTTPNRILCSGGGGGNTLIMDGEVAWTNNK